MVRAGNKVVVALLVAAIALPSGLGAASPPAALGGGGAVVSAERASTEVGLEILRRGGNAADAAVATALAMAVVHPQAGNLGGGGFAVARFRGELDTLDFRETAPAAAHRSMFLDDAGEPLPDASAVGPLATGVPGTPAGLWELHRRYGSMPWKEVVVPAIELAESGFVVTRRLAETIASERSVLERFPETAARWLPGGEVPVAGSRLRLPALARTLRAYAQDGPGVFAEGPLAAEVLEVVGRYGGILTAADLAGYRPEWRPPLQFTSLGWRFAAMDLPSSGGYLVAAALEMLERLRWSEHPRFGAQRQHLLAEAWRRVFADRTALGDPASTDAKLVDLLAPQRLQRLVESIDPARASASAGLPRVVEEPRLEPLETVHLSVIDDEGNVVALTTTLNWTFGCGLWVPGGGFFLNNEMDDFSTVPGRPNLYGLVQGAANEVAPGRRMLSSMSPTIAWRESEVVALGGRGGSRIPTAVLQVLLNLLVDSDGLQSAVDRSRIHHQWLPDQITAEPDALSPETRERLEAMGHTIELVATIAKVNTARLRADGRFEAAGDSRGPAAAGVVEPLP